MTTEVTESSALGKLLLLGVALCLFIAAILAATGLEDMVMLWEKYSDHPVRRHGLEDTNAIRCTLDHTDGHLMYNPDTQRTAECVELPDGRWGVQICDMDECEITSFVRKSAKSLQDMIDYLTRSGYK